MSIDQKESVKLGYEKWGKTIIYWTVVGLKGDIFEVEDGFALFCDKRYTRLQGDFLFKSNSGC